MRIPAWMCVLIAVNQLGFGSIVPALARYARSFDVTQSAIGLAIAVYGLARFLIAVPSGLLANRLGRRTALAAGGLLSALGNALCALAPTYAAFVGARFVAGAGAALVLTTGPSLWGWPPTSRAPARRWAAPPSCLSRWRCSSPASRRRGSKQAASKLGAAGLR